jgi:hypothetical protein
MNYGPSCALLVTSDRPIANYDARQFPQLMEETFAWLIRYWTIVLFNQPRFSGTSPLV